MSINQQRLSAFFGGLYTWVVTIFFGMVLLDIVYAHQTPKAVTAFSEVSDFLLLIGALTVLAAIGAIAFSWQSRSARIFFAASLVILFLEFAIPVFLSPLFRDMQSSAWPTIVRIMVSGSASVLAFLGLHKLYR